MSQLLSAHNLTHSFAGKTLFKNVNFGIFEKDRIGLVGPNGAGKSTLLKILSRHVDPDDGEVVNRRGLRVGYLAQSPAFADKETLFEALIAKADDPHEAMGKAYEWMSKLQLDQFPSDILVSALSGGWKKRLALARELITEPDLMLLDEPTNHLDVESILWLENFIEESPLTFVTITHDRLFLQRVATKIFDLDPKNPQYLLAIDGDYVKYLESKEILMKGEQSREKKMKNTLRRETEWLRRGAKARLTKQQARIDSAHALGDETAELSARNRARQVRIDFGESDKNPKKLIEAIDVSKTFVKDGQELKVIENFNYLIGPKTRLGLLGVNGSGKSTLIRTLLGYEKPDRGEVKMADRIQISYFEQNRETLDPKKSVLRNVCSDGDYVIVQGTAVYAKSYLERFLFSHQQMDLPVEKLSGGEQSRLRIAQIMLKPASVLVLDEPTNDLDLDTLNVLEDALRDFSGAVILVTHDRYFMDQVCNEILAFTRDSKGHPHLEKFADYLQWEAWALEHQQAQKAAEKKARQENSPKGKKLSFKEKFELENMEEKILGLESELHQWQAESQKPEVVSSSTKLQELFAKMAERQTLVDGLYARWSELEAKVKGT